MIDANNTDWAAVKVDYDNGKMSVAAVLDRHKITRSALEQVARQEGWRRRSATRAIGRSALISRLFRLLERQIAQFEKNAAETNMTEPGDKEVALLGNLTRNLEKLIDLDVREKGRASKKERRPDIDALRIKVAKRIEQLRKI